MFICSAVQHIKIGDLSMHAATSTSFISSDVGSMDIDASETQLPSGIEESQAIAQGSAYSREEERTLARESTAGFAGMHDLFMWSKVV